MRNSVLKVASLAVSAVLAFSISGCSSGGGGDSSENADLARGGSDAANFNCDGDCPNQNLTEADVARIIQQGIAGAQNLGVAATIVVIDRPANVLAAYQMPGAQATSVITSGSGLTPGEQGGPLEGVSVPAVFCAISKAGTSAYFSSQGNAFTTRTANQVLQENFNPGELFAPSGPLFGVQFSQGLCSDINFINPDLLPGTVGNTTARGLTGPRPLPLGFAAEPGTVPLYKNGDMVGAVAVEFDGVYSRDTNLFDVDDNPEERIALSASIGFEAPSERTANTIFVRGKSLRYTDLRYEDIAPLPQVLPALDPANLLSVAGFTNGTIRRGAIYGQAESGFVRITRAGVEAEILVDENGNNRFPSKNGASQGGVELTAAEVEALLDASLLTAERTRSQVRRPRDTRARLAIWIIDITGDVIGFVRSKDTILDSTDVTLQKARAAMFFSSPDAGAALRADGRSVFVDAAESLLGPNAFDGTFAWSTTALGNISRPFFPDGTTGSLPGPFSLPSPDLGIAGRNYSIFNLGLQLDIYIDALLAPLGGTIPNSCTNQAAYGNRIRNGVQFFAGAFPLYRNGVLIGAIASSGDGTEQDDLIPFYGASRRGLDFAGYTTVGDPELGFHAPKERRADQIQVNFPRTNLRYVACPEGPFIRSNEQNVCGGL